MSQNTPQFVSGPTSPSGNLHKRRLEDDDNDMVNDRAKRRLIQTFETLSLANKSSTTDSPHFTDAIGSATLRNNDVNPFVPSEPLLFKPAANTSDSVGWPQKKEEPKIDYMDASAPNKIFIPSIDEFLAQEGDSGAEQEEEEVNPKEYPEDDGSSSSGYDEYDDDWSGEYGFDSEVENDHVNQTSRKLGDGHCMEGSDDYRPTRDSILTNGRLSELSNQQQGDVDRIHQHKKNRRHKNKVKRLRIVGRAAREAVMRVPDSVLRASSPSSLLSRTLRNIPDSTRILGAPGVIRMNGGSGSGLDGEYTFFERPSRELIKYEPAEHIIWKHFARWMLEKEQAEDINMDDDEPEGYQSYPTQGYHRRNMFDQNYTSPGYQDSDFTNGSISQPQLYHQNNNQFNQFNQFQNPQYQNEVIQPSLNQYHQYTPYTEATFSQPNPFQNGANQTYSSYSAPSRDDDDDLMDLDD